MKGFITAFGVIAIGAMFAVWALVELVTWFAPVLVAVAAWTVFAALRARRRNLHDDDRLVELWTQTRQVGIAPSSVRQPVALPRPYAPHYERFYVLRGDDTGFAADRADGYLNVCTPAVPPAGQHQPRLPALRRQCRPRPTRRTSRP